MVSGVQRISLSLNYNLNKSDDWLLFSQSDMGPVEADGVWLPAVLQVV